MDYGMCLGLIMCVYLACGEMAANCNSDLLQESRPTARLSFLLIRASIIFLDEGVDAQIRMSSFRLRAPVSGLLRSSNIVSILP